MLPTPVGLVPFACYVRLVAFTPDVVVNDLTHLVRLFDPVCYVVTRYVVYRGLDCCPPIQRLFRVAYGWLTFVVPDYDARAGWLYPLLQPYPLYPYSCMTLGYLACRLRWLAPFLTLLPLRRLTPLCRGLFYDCPLVDAACPGF